MNGHDTGALRKGAQDKLGEFLVAEYGHVTDSFLRNEESGEKRAAFFLTLAGGAGAVLTFGFNGEHPIIDRSHFPAAVLVTAVVIFALGLMTWRRLLERIRQADEYIYAMRDLRRLFISEVMSDAVPNSFFKPYKGRAARKFHVLSIGKGGWLESVALVNACVAAVAGASAMRLLGTPPAAMSIVGAAVFAATWSIQVLYGKAWLPKELQHLHDADSIQRACGREQRT